MNVDLSLAGSPGDDEKMRLIVADHVLEQRARSVRQEARQLFCFYDRRLAAIYSELRMCREESGLEGFVVKARLCEFGTEFCEVLLIDLFGAVDLPVEHGQIQLQPALQFAFLGGHRLLNAYSAVLEHIQKHTRFGAFGECESFSGLVVGYKQTEHASVCAEPSLKEAPILVLAPRVAVFITPPPAGSA